MYVQSSTGEHDLKNEEGLRLKAYRDSNGDLTVGYGHKMFGNVLLMTISQAQAEALYHQDVQRILIELWSEIKTLTQNEVDGLVPFIFNIGINAWRGSTARRDLLSGHIGAVPIEMLRWVHDDHGNVLSDLVGRRNREVAIFTGANKAA